MMLHVGSSLIEGAVVVISCWVHQSPQITQGGDESDESSYSAIYSSSRCSCSSYSDTGSSDCDPLQSARHGLTLALIIHIFLIKHLDRKMIFMIILECSRLQHHYDWIDSVAHFPKHHPSAQREAKFYPGMIAIEVVLSSSPQHRDLIWATGHQR